MNAHSPDNGRPQRLVGAVLILAMAILSCGTPGKNLPVTEGRAEKRSDGVQEIEIKVQNYYFEPSLIHVQVNVPTRLILNSDAFLVPHNFSIHAPEAGLDIHQDIASGKTERIEFTPTKVGEYPFHCDKEGHTEKGMAGTLVVDP